MTPEQIALVQSSFSRLGPRRPALAARFYEELFARHPDLRPLFTTGMAEQQARFAEKLTVIVHGDALFAALTAVLGDSFDAETREAWTLAYNLVAETMLDGAAAARLTGS